MTVFELEQCIEEYGKEIYSFCLHLTGVREWADELYQDTFLTAMEHITQLHNEAGSSGGMRMSEFELLFPDDAPRISILGYGISGGGADGSISAYISVLRRYEDGTITCVDYVPKDLDFQP